MIDRAFIDELKELSLSDDKDDQKKAKDELADYAKELGIKVRKTLSFDNMVAHIEEELQKLKSEMDDTTSGDGTSITDLINAADTADGKVVFDEVDPELVKEFEDTKTDSEPVSVEPAPVVEEEPVSVPEPEPIKEGNSFIAMLSESVAPKPTPNTEELCDLTGFRPTITLIGGGRGYYTCPWWIFDWIQNTPDWKAHPEKFPHAYVLDTLKSLIYYIKRDGSVKVRETKHSQFHTLK